LTIIIDGQQRVIRFGIGIHPDGNQPIHTRDASAILHLESTVAYRARLGDFFTIRGQDFSRTDILGHHTDNTHVIRMFMNGWRSNAFGSLVLRNLQDIVIEEITIPKGPARA
jgi:hypothetical protein